MLKLARALPVGSTQAGHRNKIISAFDPVRGSG